MSRRCRHPIALLLAGSLAAAAAGPVAAPGAAMEALVARADLLSRSDPEAARMLAEEALARQPAPDLEARLRLTLCDYFIEHDRNAVPPHLARLQALLPRLQRSGLRAGVLACEGQWRESAGENVSAMLLYDQAVAAAEAAHDDEATADALYLRGYLLGVVGEYARGLADLRRALASYERLQRPLQARATLSGVATVYLRMGDLDQARQFFEEALASHRPDVVSRERAIALHHLASTYLAQNRWDEAADLYEQVLAQSRELGYAFGQAQALRSLAAVHNGRKQGRQALARVAEAEKLVGPQADQRLRASLMQQRGAALRLEHRFAEALPPLRAAVEIFHRAEAVAEECEARDDLALLLADLGDWHAAHDEQVAARRIEEALLTRQRDQRFASMKVQFDTEAKVKENALLQREKQATERALAEQQRASQLQIVAIGLALSLALSLGALAWRQRRTSRTMRDLAMTDELTGLPNRRQSMRELVQMVGRPAVDGVVLMIDIDRFKPINDQHGHAVGDEILIAVTDCCRALAARPGAQFGRLGGEEFLVMLAHGGLAEGLALAEALRAAVAALDVSRWLPDRGITVSIGVTALSAGDSTSSVLARADHALYRAKSNGRNRVESA